MMETILKPPSSLSFEGNLKENWRQWIEDFEIYLRATDLEAKSDERKIAVLLHVAGREAIAKFNTFGLSDDNKKKYSEVKKAFENFCTPKANESVERHIFFSRVQKNGESFTSFLTDLKKLSATCEFGTLRDSLIKDRIISGIVNQQVKNRLLRENNLTLDRCVEICKAAELAELQMKTIGDEEKQIQEVKAKNKDFKEKGTNNNKQRSASSQNGARAARGDGARAARGGNTQAARGGGGGSFQRERQGQRQGGSNCTRCGRQHAPRQCPAYGKTCKICRGLNHFANVCRKREINAVGTDNLSSLAIDTVTRNSNKNNFERNNFNRNAHEWLENIIVNDRHKIEVKLDTGAHCNVISLQEFNRIKGEVRLNNPNTLLSGYGGRSIKVIGICKLDCKFVNRDKSLFEFTVVDGSKNKHPTVIGLPTLLNLNLIKRIETISQLSENQIFKDYKDVFENMGIINDFEYDIKLKEGAKGSIAACRKVPIALMGKLKTELKKMIRMGIIERVNEPSDWVSPLVLAQKKNGDIRMCLDPTDINKNVKRQHHVIPTFDELCAQMPNAKVFSTLDADRGFWQIKVTNKTSEFLTFITPFGRFRFKVMPFGISPATEVFQSCFDQIFGDIEGVIILIDDVLVWGSTVQEHDARLRKVLDRARERNVTFNKSKCQFKKSEVKYVGHVFTDNGIKIDPDKTKAIIEMQPPKNKDELSTFLGMLAYVGRFVPNLSSANSNLRNLTKKNVEWVWDANAQKEFENLKNVLVNSPTLKYYDVNKPVVLSVDEDDQMKLCLERMCEE